MSKVDQSGPEWTAARLAYVVSLMLATLVPFVASTDGALVAGRLLRAFSPTLGGSDLIDGVRNVVLFAGWGVVWMLTRPSAPNARGVLGALLSGCALSGTAEVLQLFTANRNSSVLDLFTNTVGAGLGALCALRVISFVRRARGRQSYVGVPTLLIAGPYLCAGLAEAAFPLARSGTLPVVWGDPLERLRTVLGAADFSISGHFAASDVLLFLPAGFLAVMALVEMGNGYLRAATLTAGIGAALVAAGELAHGFVGYPIAVAPVLAHAAGFAAGATAAALWLPALSRRLRGRTRPAAFLLVYVALLLFWSWRPFLPESSLVALLEDLAPRRWVPVLAYSEQVNLYSVADVSVSFFLYLPVGALLAVWPLRRRGWLSGVWPGLYCAFVLELGQAFIATRYFDVSDMLIPFAAIAIGRSIARRAGYGPYGELLQTNDMRGYSRPGERVTARS